jgi:hypothetical protein
MIQRYVFLTQRGWTEKEKVARSRAAKRYQLEHEEFEYNKKLTVRERLHNVKKFFTQKLPASNI